MQLIKTDKISYQLKHAIKRTKLNVYKKIAIKMKLNSVGFADQNKITVLLSSIILCLYSKHLFLIF